MITDHDTSNQINTGCLHSLYLPLSIFIRPSSSTPSSPTSFFTLCFCPLPPSLYHLFKFVSILLSLHSPPGLTGSPVISDISLIRLSPHGAPGSGDSPFSPPHPYVSPHMEHYLRSVHSSPTLSMISAARGLSPAEGKIHPTYRHLAPQRQ